MVAEEQGRLGLTNLPVDLWSVPARAWVDGARLHYEPKREKRDGFGVPVTGLLDSFVRIESPEDVARFAVRWGVMELCEHNLPYTHNLSWPFAVGGRCDVWSDELGHGVEPLDFWFSHVQNVRCLLRVAAAAQSRTAPAPRDIDELLDISRGLGLISGSPALQDEPWYHVEGVVFSWNLIGRLIPRLSGTPESPVITFTVGTFGTVALQVMQAVSRTHGFSFCSSCGLPYLRLGRKAQAGRRNYCQTCGRSAAMRDAQRAYAARKKGTDGQAQG